MKEVFVLYGRVYWSSALSPICYGWHETNTIHFEGTEKPEVFDSFEKAYCRFSDRVAEAVNYLKENNPLSSEALEKMEGAELFADYNMDEEDDCESDVQWEYDKVDGESALWQMHAVNVPVGDLYPILAELHIVKCEIG
ncbi:MAG: hypothetical protein J1E00_09315 [Oscillospiraceae bacterium]|nr:hypothetical protein [Oscillospiraceae bacterium]